MTGAPQVLIQNPSPAATATPIVASRCIRAVNLIKEYHTPVGVKRVLDGISFEVAQGEKIGVFGSNGAGKSTLMKLIGGVETPTSGVIERGLTMSWPIGLAGGFAPTMSGLDAIRFIARLYGAPQGHAAEQVDDFAELGRYLQLPISTYSSGMRARLMFGLTLIANFECLLIDEVLSVGDQRFRKKCHEELFVKRADKAMILISHDQGIVREYCQQALVLKRGRGRVFDDLDLAISIYRTL
ncbi:MAG: ABC transporter ATP-binding protein [Beijerinckiaceae bacterium]|nr:ABC transporter ATP-binding protein [Beijerinckiaceae bacterium]